MLDLVITRKPFAIGTFVLMASFLWPLAVKDVGEFKHYQRAKGYAVLPGKLVGNYQTETSAKGPKL